MIENDKLRNDTPSLLRIELTTVLKYRTSAPIVGVLASATNAMHFFLSMKNHNTERLICLSSKLGSLMLKSKQRRDPIRSAFDGNCVSFSLQHKKFLNMAQSGLMQDAFRVPDFERNKLLPKAAKASI